MKSMGPKEGERSEISSMHSQKSEIAAAPQCAVFVPRKSETGALNRPLVTDLNTYSLVGSSCALPVYRYLTIVRAVIR